MCCSLLDRLGRDRLQQHMTCVRLHANCCNDTFGNRVYANLKVTCTVITVCGWELARMKKQRPAKHSTSAPCQPTPDPVAVLGPDVASLVLALVPPTVLAVCCGVCKAWKAVADDQRTWKKHCQVCFSALHTAATFVSMFAICMSLAVHPVQTMPFATMSAATLLHALASSMGNDFNP